MPTTTSITTTYAGEFAGKYIAAALLSGVTLDKGLIEIKPNVKYKEVIKRVSTNDIVKNATCDFDPTSTLTLDERIIQPEEFHSFEILEHNTVAYEIYWVELEPNDIIRRDCGSLHPGK